MANNDSEGLDIAKVVRRLEELVALMNEQLLLTSEQITVQREVVESLKQMREDTTEACSMLQSLGESHKACLEQRDELLTALQAMRATLASGRELNMSPSFYRCQNN